MPHRSPLIFAALLLFGSAYGQERGAKIAVCDNLLRTGQKEAALLCYQQCLEADPANSALKLKVCQILEATGRVDQAGPYLTNLDRSSRETQEFMEMLSTNYATLKIICEGTVDCLRFFKASSNIKFTPPEELEPAKAIRLSEINRALGTKGLLWFSKETADRASAVIGYFPVVVGAPLPYTAEILRSDYEFNFNFVEKADLVIKTKDLFDIECAVPDTMALLQVEVDDPEYVADLAFRSNPDSEKGSYLVSRGDFSTLNFRKKGRLGINKKYLMITSLVMTSAVLLLQR